MKFSIPAKQFAVALRQAMMVIKGKRLRIPALGAARLAAADGAATISVTDLDAVLALTIPADVPEVGEVAIDAGALAALLKGLTKDSVTVAGDSKVAVIEAGSSRFELPAVPIADLPTLELGGETGRVVLSRRDAIDIFGRVPFAMSREGTRYYLNGLFLHGVDGDLAAVATDGHRLARVIIRGAGGHWSDGCIVPAGALKLVDKLLGAHRQLEEVKLRQSRALIEVEGGPFKLVSKLIDGTFPDYIRAIGTPVGENVVTVDRVELATALARIAAVAGNDKMAAAGFTWGPGQEGLRVCDANGSAGCSIPAKNARGQARTAFQVRHALDLGRAFAKCAFITIDAGDKPGNVPVWMTDGETGPAAFVAIQMPMQWPKAAS